MKPADISCGSFRDPSGFIFLQDRLLLRQINDAYRENYELLIDSGLYNHLVKNEMQVPHEELEHQGLIPGLCHKVIKPDLVSFISYPYEWCFSQLKDAALLTLDIQKKSLEHGMSLKDCSAYNIQFSNGKPLFIDTLSFEKHEAGRPWVAYRQFCQHFLAPLALMSYKDVRLSQLLRVHLDGIPLDLTASLLPFQTRLRFSMLTHIHLHAKAQRQFSEQKANNPNRFSLNAFLGIIDSLKTLVERLSWRKYDTVWGNYYQQTNYSDNAFSHKKKLVSELLDQVKPKTVLDLGANTGIYSRIAADKGARVISCDIDPAAVELNYLYCQANNYPNIMPVLVDLFNPSPGLGWANTERMTFMQRSSSNTVLALALLHHLAISNNLPLSAIAEFLGKVGETLIIEFVPKEDLQVQRLLASREDIFDSYSRPHFEEAFEEQFIIKESIAINDSIRQLYLMERR